MNSLRYCIFAITVLTLLGGCTHRVMTQAERLKATSRVYQNIDPSEIYTAAGDLFFLADVSAFQVERSPTKLVATRIYGMGGLVEGTDTWTLTANKQSENTRVVLDVRSQGTWVNGETKSGEPIGPATYDQFWQRMDYLLKQSTEWMTCQDLNLAYLREETWGDTLWLCDAFADEVPPDFTKGVWQRRLGAPVTQEDADTCAQEVADGLYGDVQSALQRQYYNDRCLQRLGYRKVQEPSTQN